MSGTRLAIRSIEPAQNERKAAEALSFIDAFDGLNMGVFFVDAAGHVVHANARGNAMLADAIVVRAAGRKLVVMDKNAARALNEFFARVGRPDAAVGIKGLAVALTGGSDECFTAHALSLPSGSHKRTEPGLAAVTAIFVRKVEIEGPSLEMIAKHYSLTPAELRVLLAIVQIGGVAETADALGVSEATVKTHLHRVFGKTGTARQADLVKLMAGFSNPLVN
jgi:DNA-binding CsgD family transcriptional regulator